MDTNSPYDENVTNYRPYENEDGNMIANYSPRDIANRLFHIGNGRAYSAAFVAQGLTIGDSARLSMMRFKVNGGKTLIGREVLLKHALTGEIVAELVYLAFNKANTSRQNPAKAIIESDKVSPTLVISFWVTQTGKKTYHGKPDAGDIHLKETQNKQYKRNRRNNF